MFNPIKRNRNIGNKNQVKGSAIALPYLTGTYRPMRPTSAQRWPLNQNEVLFVIEEPLNEYQYACSVQEVLLELKKLPDTDTAGIKFVIFHQPTKREDLLSPRWAAYTSFLEFENQSGSAIFLVAVNPSQPLKWPKSLLATDKRELETLEAEGHIIETSKRNYMVTSPLAAVRKTQLFRSLIHEVGHHVDFKQSPRTFESKTKNAREIFAETYARENASSESI